MQRKVHIVMQQLGWKSDHVDVVSVFADRKDAADLRTKLLKEAWNDWWCFEESPELCKWPGIKKASNFLARKDGQGAWVLTKTLK